MHELFSQWGENIAGQRRARGWTQIELAKRVGVHRSAISLWESGDRIPTDRHKAAIAHVFGLAVRTLFPLVAEAPDEAVA